MIILFKLSFLTIITVLAWRIAVSEDMVFERVGKWAEARVDEGKKIFELLICPWCMATIWTLPAWGLAHLTGIVKFDNWNLIFYYPLCVFISSIVCGFTWTLYLTVNQIKDKNEIEAKYLKNMENISHFELKNKKAAFNKAKNIGK